MADVSKWKQVKDWSRKEILFSAARGTSPQQIWAGASDGKVYRFDLSAEKGEPQAFEGHSTYVTGVASIGGQLVSGSYDCKLIWRDLTSGEIKRTIDDAHARWIRGVVASPDGKLICSVGDDCIARLWNADGGKRHELKGHAAVTPTHYPSMLYACAFSPDSRLVATGDRIGKVIVWDTSSGNKVSEFEAKEMYTWDAKQRRHSIGGIRSLAFSPDGKQIAVGGMGQVGNIDHLEGNARVEVFDWEKKERTHEFGKQSFKGLVEHVEFHPQGEWLLGAGGAGDGFFMFFDLKAGKVIKEEKAPMHVHDVLLGDGGNTVHAVGHHKMVAWSMT